MLFLKQIRAHGFKSFAEPTNLDFTSDMIGVVGPNGSGKSNITDAIRWALGEQSAKSLRGTNLDDVVFAGAVDKKALDEAEVTLVFDNQKDYFSSIASPIVEITRRFNKKTRDSDFFINGEKVKMRDVQDIALETGLTKSSIAIISQGTISTFAEAKPDQRREIFDEAAGVAKYKKRKRETQLKLIKTVENLTRLQDISTEIGRRLPSLEKSAQKALQYKTKIEELQKFEVAILAKDVKAFKIRIEELREQKDDLESKVRNLANDINFSEEEFAQMIQQSSSSEKTLSDLNARFTEIIQRLGNLKVKKHAAEQRENVDNHNASQDELKINQIKKQFEEVRIGSQSEKDKQFRLNNRINEQKEKYDYVSNLYNETYDKISGIQKEIEKLKFEINFNERSKTMTNSFGPNAAAQMIVDHKNSLPGVIGTLLSLVNVQEKYETAISVVASASMHSVVMKTNTDVKRAIDFLKNNPIGRATFLPLDTLTPSTIQGPQKTAIQAAEGFLGFANDLVTINENYQKALDYSLGTIIVVDTYAHGVTLARNINNKFNIVTLEGERFLPHGAIVGGKAKNQNIFANNKNSNIHTSPDDLKKTIMQLENAEAEQHKNLNNVKNERDKIRDELTDLQSSIKASQQAMTSFQNKTVELNEDYRLIAGVNLTDSLQNTNGEAETIKLTREITKLEVERDEIQMQINLISVNKNKYAEQQVELNRVNGEKRKDLDEQKDILAQIKSELSALQERNLRSLQKLAETYALTEQAVLELEVPEFSDEIQVRERIGTLAKEIREIGTINMESIVEYETEKERFDYYEVSLKEIREAMHKLESIINDIDIAMKTQFKKVVDDVNDALPDAFHKLFGGGTAKLIYTEPDNILETGIDIQVNPPGKKISNLNLLSGGEKSLVALSVLFSILKVRPLPLVILDEAEAPLDPANVERFARYVKQFTANTQFIIVTHREGTMENCDVLFGVTMESKGVTKIVKIKLIDAKALVIQETEKLN